MRFVFADNFAIDLREVVMMSYDNFGLYITFKNNSVRNDFTEMSENQKTDLFGMYKKYCLEYVGQ